MKIFSLLMCSILLLTASTTAQKKISKAPKAKTEKQAFATQKEKIGYVVGYDQGMRMAADIKKREFELNLEMFAQGMHDALTEKKNALPDSEVTAAMSAFQQQVNEMQRKQFEAHQQVLEKAKRTGEEFLTSNKLKDSVNVTASGLQYKILRAGSGASPKATDTVVTQYRGSLIDGTVFDESYKRGEPTTFPVNGVIKGWTEALQLMNVGAKWQLVIPSELAYGERGAGQMIQPNATLVFEIELLEIKKGPGETPAAPVVKEAAPNKK